MVKNLCFSHDVKLSPFLFIFFQSIQLNLFLKNLTSTKISGFFFFTPWESHDKLVTNILRHKFKITRWARMKLKKEKKEVWWPTF